MTTPENAARHLQRMRDQRPLIHNITNYVAMDISANVLLALGASPAMIHANEEVEDFVSLSSAVVLNIGTLSPDWVEAMHRAGARARELDRPLVLDPVGAGATHYRTATALNIIQSGVTVVRGNASEIIALAGTGGRGTRGVDAADPVDEASTAAEALAREHGCVVAVTGEVDLVTDGRHTRVRVAGGSSLMGRVTAIGCSLSATVAAFVATADGETSPLAATTHALTCFAVAGKQAGAASPGPGSFRTAFLDALFALSPEMLKEKAEVLT